MLFQKIYIYLDRRCNYPCRSGKAHQRLLPIHLCYYNFTCLYFTGSILGDVGESDHARYLYVMQICTYEYQFLL